MGTTNNELELNIDLWVKAAKEPKNIEFRQAIHTILQSIATDKKLKANMVLKGGILLAVRYQSDRFTKDIDLSTSKTLKEINPVQLVNQLNKNLAITSEELDYSLECLVQTHKVMPPQIKNASFPSIKITVGYAYKGTNKHRRLQVKQSPSTISIDFSLNESIPNIDEVEITEGKKLLVYSLVDLIAEKLRALLQQENRDRYRRQDVFDLCLVFEYFGEIKASSAEAIYISLLKKCRARNIEPTQHLFSNSELKQRAKKDYHTLKDELESELPDFEESFNSVKLFYESLPWPKPE